MTVLNSKRKTNLASVTLCFFKCSSSDLVRMYWLIVSSTLESTARAIQRLHFILQTRIKKPLAKGNTRTAQALVTPTVPPPPPPPPPHYLLSSSDSLRTRSGDANNMAVWGEDRVERGKGVVPAIDIRWAAASQAGAAG